MKTGIIYKLSSPSGKCYIGQTWDFKARKRKYRCLCCNAQPKIYNAIKKYGWKSFNVSFLDKAYNQTDLNNKEIFWIKHFDSVSKGYNCKDGGGQAKLSNEAREKISNANRGRVMSKETRRKMSDSKKGIKKTPEHVEKVAIKNRGRKLSEAHKELLRNRVVTKETRIKMSKSATGRRLSDNAKKKLSDFNKGKVLTEENMDKFLKGAEKYRMENKELIKENAKKNGRSVCKLSDQDVREIRKSELSCYALAKVYNVGHMAIYNVKKNKSYKHVI